jgi:N-methylhydantoinase A
MSGFGMIDRPRIPKVERTAGDPPKGGSRPVYFEGKFRDTPVYERAALGAGAQLAGPAIVEEFGSTTVVFPGQRLSVDAHGILVISAAGKTGAARN